MTFTERLQYEWNKGSMVNRLIFINVAVFLFFAILGAVLGLFRIPATQFISDWFALHANLKHLLITPYTFITHGFMHNGFMHILFNMLWLYWIGQILEEYIGARKIVPIYLFGVLLGGLFFVLAYNVFPLFSEAKLNATAVGASAGVMAIIWATVTLLPKYEIRLFLIGTVPLIYVALFMSVLDLIGISGANAGGKIAHLGGALAGFLFIDQYRAGRELSKPFNTVLDWIANVFRPTPKQPFQVKRNSKRSTKKGTPSTTRKSVSNEKRLNQILDKMNDSGYESLTAEEREFLFTRSKDS